MIKKFISSLIILTFVLSIAACSGGNKSPDKGGEGKTEIQIIVTQNSLNSTEFWSEFEEDFEDKYKDVDLNIEIMQHTDITALLPARISNGRAPDILNIKDFENYYMEGELSPIDSFISDETLDKFFPQFLEMNRIENELWALPANITVNALYYNEDILHEAGVICPKNFAEFKSACATLKAYDDSIYPWGVSFEEGEGVAYLSSLDKNPLGSVEEAIALQESLISEDYTNVNPWSDTNANIMDMFGAGQVAMTIAPNTLQNFLLENGYAEELNYNIAPIPTVDGQGASVGDESRLMVFKKDYSPKKQEAIKNFLEYFYNDDNYSEWAANEGFLAATESALDLTIRTEENKEKWPIIVKTCTTISSMLN